MTIRLYEVSVVYLNKTSFETFNLKQIVNFVDKNAINFNEWNN